MSLKDRINNWCWHKVIRKTETKKLRKSVAFLRLCGFHDKADVVQDVADWLDPTRDM